MQMHAFQLAFITCIAQAQSEDYGQDLEDVEVCFKLFVCVSLCVCVCVCLPVPEGPHPSCLCPSWGWAAFLSSSSRRPGRQRTRGRKVKGQRCSHSQKS